MIGLQALLVCIARFEGRELFHLLPKCKYTSHVQYMDILLESHSSCRLCGNASRGHHEFPAFDCVSCHKMARALLAQNVQFAFADLRAETCFTSFPNADTNFTSSAETSGLVAT
ncbi:hypothetical protein EJ110_NYTH44516 [Nymphaea thermarum]|nr:hypothetical protein EJ110_NYTH44516 [Nymphaea thermarum]